MDTQEAIKFVASFRSNKTGLVGYQLSLTQVRARNDKLNEVTYILAQGELFRKMWEDFKSTYGYRTTYDASGENQLSKLINIMDTAEVAFLGSRPRSIRERINGMIENLNSMGVAIDTKELVNLLIELRDKEEGDMNEGKN